MCIISQLSYLPKNEISIIKNQINLTEDENTVFDMFISGKSAIQVADKLSLSERSIYRRKRSINTKLSALFDAFKV